MGNQRDDKNASAVRKDLQWHKSVLDSIIDAMLIISDDGLVISSNQAAQRLFDYPAAELIGQPINLLIPDLHTEKQEGSKPFFAPEGIDHEHEAVRRDNLVFPLRMDLSKFEHDGQSYYVALMRDDSANKKAEEMQRETLMEAIRDLELEKEESDKRRTEIRAIIDTSVDAIAVVRPDSTFDYVDNRFTEFFGIDENEITNRKWAEVMPLVGRIFENPQAVFELLEGSAADEEVEIREVVTQRWPQFRELDLQSRSVITKHGRYLGRLYVFRDVTHEREVDRMKTQFVSMVSHELRTPLTSIKGFTEMILDEDFGEINEEQREFLGIVESNADRLISLVNDLLDISRIESGRVQLKRELVDVEEMITIVVATLEHLIAEKAQALEVVVEQDLPPVELDRDRIVQVLTNLLSNAYKYTQTGGHIRLSAERADGALYFAVADNGFGISEQDQEKLFTRFFRVDSELTREIGGTGLGLNIVKTIIEMHGGEVSLNSELGAGSTFAFTIPLTDEDKQPSDEELSEDAKASLKGRKILVVEDEPDIALLIRSLLEKAGYFVETVATGEEAWAYLRDASEPPNLITLDIELPGMSGIELASKMAAEAKLADIPILMISIYGDDPAAEKLAFVESLAKPIDRTQLLKKVSIMLGQADTAGRVLMIEDRFSQQEALTAALEEQGMEVLQAADGTKGLEMAAEERPDLILLGMQLPDMDGTTILRTLKQKEETAAIPVIIASDEGYQLSERARALALGAADFVTGPFDLDIILEEVKMFMYEDED